MEDICKQLTALGIPAPNVSHVSRREDRPLSQRESVVRITGQQLRHSFEEVKYLLGISQASSPGQTDASASWIDAVLAGGDEEFLPWYRWLHEVRGAVLYSPPVAAHTCEEVAHLILPWFLRWHEYWFTRLIQRQTDADSYARRRMLRHLWTRWRQRASQRAYVRRQAVSPPVGRVMPTRAKEKRMAVPSSCEDPPRVSASLYRFSQACSEALAGGTRAPRKRGGGHGAALGYNVLQLPVPLRSVHKFDSLGVSLY